MPEGSTENRLEHRASSAERTRSDAVWLWTSRSAITFQVGLAWLALGLAFLVYLTREFRRRPPVLDLSETEIEPDRDAGDQVEGVAR